MHRTHHILPIFLRPLIVGALLLCLSSCSQVEDARHVVAEADSLRVAGVAYSDSAAIADAAATLEHVRLIYPTDYAHANYYYGRLLREAGNQPEAMLAFLRVVHSRTEDHAVLARAYSNMGTMCNWAEEYALSYDMYCQCAHHFLVCNDSSMYYYALNAMALELAEQHHKSEAQSVLDKIEKECPDKGVLTKIWETRGRLYLIEEQYDSALYCVDVLQQKGNMGATGYVTKAQAFSYLGINDSAVYYANTVMNLPDAIYQNKYNVLYILSNNDSTISKDKILSLTSQRADIGVYQLMPQTELFAKATQLLEQDLNRKPDLKWLWAIIITIAIIGTALTMYIKRKRRQHQLYSQRVAKAQEEHRNLSNQNTQLEQSLTQHQKKALTEIEVFCTGIQNRSDLNEKLYWKDFSKMCFVVNQRMFELVDKLNKILVLNEKEMRLCVLIVIGNFNNNEMADIICYDPHSLRSIKSKIAGQLGISGKNMHSYLLKLAIGG